MSQKLFNYIRNDHATILLQSEMQEIKDIVLEEVSLRAFLKIYFRRIFKRK